MRLSLKSFIGENKLAILLSILLIPLFIILYKIYIPRINAFGCFDDCNNFMGGYFILQGKQIFSDFFFNHQPLAAYISFLVQKISDPENIYELILRHRQFIFLINFIVGLLLVFRFKIPALIFIVIFEFTKFYLFGDRFLSEAMISYPLVYMAGLTIEKAIKHKLHQVDYYLTALFAWFVIFSREPYVPLTILLLIMIFFEKSFKKVNKLPIILAAVLSLITLFSFNIAEYFYNVIYVNYKAVLPAEKGSEMFGPSIFQSFFYPLYIPFEGPSNVFKNFLIGINLSFLIIFGNLIKSKKYFLALTVFLVLGLANLRVVKPGTIYFEAFHLLVWYSLFLFFTIFLISKAKLNLKLLTSGVVVLTFVFYLFNPLNFIYEKSDPHAELLTNYGSYLEEGQLIQLLSKPKDTLFLDASDDLLYWQSQRKSPYEYAWYTSAMVYFPKYTKARTEMFKNNPPVFYREYGSCPKENKAGQALPNFVENKYINLKKDGKKSCIYVLRGKIKEISKKQLKEAAKMHYEIPKTTQTD